MTTERRKTPRLRTILGGRISFNQRRSTLDCIVRNISESGALLHVSAAVALPSDFDLDIAQRQKSYKVQLRWSDGTRIGIVFASQADSATETAPQDLTHRLMQYEHDNARLKARITQLTEAG